MHAQWANDAPTLYDDPHLPRFSPGNFRKGLISFAGGGPDSRTHHIFISTGDQANFLGGAKHETPFGTIDGGADVSIVQPAAWPLHAPYYQ